MPDHEAVTEAVPAEVAPAFAVPAAAQSSMVERVLALQRSAGNAAVGRMLARLKTGPHEWKDPKIAELLENDQDDGDFHRYIQDERDGGPARLAEAKQARWEFRAEQDKLDPDNPAHQPAYEAWRKKIQKIDDSLLHEAMMDAQQSAPLDDAPEGGWKPGTRPERLTSKTRELTDAQRDQVRDSILPTGSKAAAGPFISTLPGETETWQQKVTKAFDDLYTDMKGGLVTGKTDADRTPENLTPWERFHAIADIAKEECDKVFGSYNRGPAMRHGEGVHGGNLWDRFDVKNEENAKQKGETDAKHDANMTDYAFRLAKNQLAAAKDVARINAAHNADMQRDTVSEGEAKSEAAMVKEILDDLVKRRRQDILDVDRGWRGTARGSVVLLQRWHSADPVKRRQTWWYTFQMLVHEYLHTLTHGRYVKFAESQSDLAHHMWIEGVTSLFTEIVWANVSYRYWTGSLPQKVEGPDYVGDKETKAAVAANMPWPRYGAYEQALKIMDVVGPHNMFAAYLLGETELIRPTGVKKQ